MAGFFFRLAGVPAFREGFRFSLPGIDIEVAEQCSGIRSAVALLITSLLMGHLFLRSSWKKLCLVLAAVPVTIFKNGLRIVTISLLSVHPSLDSLTFLIHRYGGIPFSLLGIAVLSFLVTSLNQSDRIAWKGHAD
jgi:exosortase